MIRVALAVGLLGAILALLFSVAVLGSFGFDIPVGRGAPSPLTGALWTAAIIGGIALLGTLALTVASDRPRVGFAALVLIGIFGFLGINYFLGLIGIPLVVIAILLLYAVYSARQNRRVAR